MALEDTLRQNQNKFIKADETRMYLDCVFKFEELSDNVIKIFPEPRKAGHPIGNFSWHSDVFEVVGDKIIKFKIPYTPDQ